MNVAFFIKDTWVVCANAEKVLYLSNDRSMKEERNGSCSASKEMVLFSNKHFLKGFPYVCDSCHAIGQRQLFVNIIIGAFEPL